MHSHSKMLFTLTVIEIAKKLAKMNVGKIWWALEILHVSNGLIIRWIASTSAR